MAKKILKSSWEYCMLYGEVKDVPFHTLVNVRKNDDILLLETYKSGQNRMIKLLIMSSSVSRMLDGLRDAVSKLYPVSLVADVQLSNGYSRRMRIPANKFVVDKDKLLVRKVRDAVKTFRI